MSVRYTVDLDELRARIEEMTDFERSMLQALDTLEATVARLHLHWTGEAAAAQREAHAAWVRGVHEMREGLATIRTAADRAHANYTAAGDANARMWRAVR